MRRHEPRGVRRLIRRQLPARGAPGLRHVRRPRGGARLRAGGVCARVGTPRRPRPADESPEAAEPPDAPVQTVSDDIPLGAGYPTDEPDAPRVVRSREQIEPILGYGDLPLSLTARLCSWVGPIQPPQGARRRPGMRTRDPHRRTLPPLGLTVTLLLAACAAPSSEPGAAPRADVAPASEPPSTTVVSPSDARTRTVAVPHPGADARTTVAPGRRPVERRLLARPLHRPHLRRRPPARGDRERPRHALPQRHSRDLPPARQRGERASRPRGARGRGGAPGRQPHAGPP